MKVFNSSKARKFIHDYHPDFHPKMTIEEIKDLNFTRYIAEPGKTIDVPDPVAKFWLKQYPKVFMTDEQANRAEIAYQQALKDRDAKIAEQEQTLSKLQQQLDDIQGLVLAAANGDKKAKTALSALSSSLDSTTAAPPPPAGG